MSDPLYTFDYNGSTYCNMSEKAALAAKVPQATIDAAKTVVALKVLAARRYEAEIAGTIWSSHPVATDRQSQALVMGALLATMQNPAATVEWKMKDGTFVTLTAADVEAMAQAVRAHVQAAFANEKALVPAVQANFSADISTGWPTT